MSKQLSQHELSAPSRLATWLELRAPLDWATLLFGAPHLARAPRGDGRPVLLGPGYRTDESSMRPLGRYLTFLGYDVYDWGLGRNNGEVDTYMHQVGELATEILGATGGRSVTVIGWSLGGVIAREVCEGFAETGAEDREAGAQALLALVELERGRFGEAREAVARAAPHTRFARTWDSVAARS